MNTNVNIASKVETDVDNGLRNYMLAVYNRMFVGVALSGFAALLMSYLSVGSNGRLNEFGEIVLKGPLHIVLALSPLVIVLFMSFGSKKFSAATLALMFYGLSVLMGISLTSVALAYTAASMAKVFFITASTFGALSLYGYTTKRSLTGLGSFLIMGLFGVVIAAIVNIFLQSSALDFVLSVVGVLVFAGLTAYDTQKIKEMYDFGNEDRAKLVTHGALSLYLDFINLFLFFLHFFGSSNDD